MDSFPQLHVYQGYDEEKDRVYWYTPVKRNENAIKLNYEYGIIIYNGGLVIMNLDTCMFAAKTVCKRVSALSKNGKEKDPIDYFENDEGRAKALLLSEVTGKPLNELIYPDISRKIFNTGVKDAHKAIDVNNDVSFFGTLWLDLRFYVKIMQWANYTVDFDLILYDSYVNNVPVQLNSVLQSVERTCLPMTNIHETCCMYVCSRSNETDKCKMGISYATYESLRDEYIRLDPDAVFHLYRPIPNGDKIETLIKKEHINDRVMGPNGVPSEVYKIAPSVMVNMIKEFDPEWKRVVKAKHENEYILIDSKQYNLKRSDSLMKALKSMKITNTTITSSS